MSNAAPSPSNAPAQPASPDAKAKTTTTKEDSGPTTTTTVTETASPEITPVDKVGTVVEEAPVSPVIPSSEPVTPPVDDSSEIIETVVAEDEPAPVVEKVSSIKVMPFL